MPDYFGLYEDLTVREYLHFFAAAYDLPEENRDRLIDDVLTLTDLVHKIDTLVDHLSRGMKQRLGLARVLLHDPELLLLDEPASGLDPRARIEVREILKELSAMGKTILISSHILHELSQLCTRIGILEAGKLATEGSLRGNLSPARPDADRARAGDLRPPPIWRPACGDFPASSRSTSRPTACRSASGPRRCRRRICWITSASSGRGSACFSPRRWSSRRPSSSSPRGKRHDGRRHRAGPQNVSAADPPQGSPPSWRPAAALTSPASRMRSSCS